MRPAALHLNDYYIPKKSSVTLRYIIQIVWLEMKLDTCAIRTFLLSINPLKKKEGKIKREKINP